MDFITNDAIITEFMRGGKKTPFNKMDMKAHLNNEIKKILKHGQKKFSVALLPIKNREVRLPKGFYVLTQALYLSPGDYFGNTQRERLWEKKGIDFEKCMCDKQDPANIDKCEDDYKVKYTLKDYSCDNNCVLDLIFNPNFLMYSDIQVARVGPDSDKIRKLNTAYIMRPRTNNFDNLQYHINGCFTINMDTTITYEIEDNSLMTVNMKEGYVLLSYLEDKIDKDGFLLIPSDPFVQDALLYSLNLKIAEFNLLRNVGNNVYRGMHRELYSLYQVKMVAAERQMKKINKDKLDILLELKWDRRSYDNPINDYVVPENIYPDY